MIVPISSPVQAEAILRWMAQTRATGEVIFDIDPALDWRTVPVVLRVCAEAHTTPGEYLGWNIWGEGFEKRSTYCPHCGYAMKTLASVALAVQGDRVVNTSYRPIER